MALISTDEHTSGDVVKNAYDKGVATVGGKIWNGVKQVLTSGFGKGVLLAAVVAMLGAGLSVAAAASAGHFTLATAMGPMAISGEHGFLIGVGQGFSHLFRAGGMLAMAAGGALGFVADKIIHHNDLTPQQAREQAHRYEQERELQQQRQLRLTPEIHGAASELSPGFHQAREQARRNQATNVQQL